MRFWLGGYTADMDGDGAGIGVLLAGDADAPSAGGPLSFAGTAVAVDSPSWLAQHPTLDVVYAALEGSGGVRAFTRTGPATLAPIGTEQPAGDVTCHVVASPDGRWLTATGYGDGTVARYRLDDDGVPGAPEFGAAAVDPYADSRAPRLPDDLGADATTAAELAAATAALRGAVGDEFAHLLPEQPVLPEGIESAVTFTDPDPVAPPRTSHAHQARHVSGGLVATTDLGFDLVRLWRDGQLQQEVVLPFGTGPRHTVWHPSGHLYVVTEYSCEVYVLAPDATGRWRIVSAAPVSPEASVGADFPGELSASADAGLLYAGVRGINAIAALRVLGDGSHVESIATVESHVDWPRHHILVSDTLLVAGQRSNEVVSLAIDERSGIPGRRRFSTPAPTPSVLLPIFD
ncbi:lactonase family protein [Microbacterium sp. GXS0129]|uniref:lactonase family protein n=1 Tax=Microbacterium sp. GXS0129 TaxID=3377836 RepID=UPI00383A82DE